MDALAQLPCLRHREDGLAAARSPAHLHPVQQPGDGQDRGLLDSEPFGVALPLVGLGEQGALREVAPPEDVDDEVTVVVRGDAVAALLVGGDVPEPTDQVLQVIAAVDAPPWTVRCGEVVVDIGVGQDDRVSEPHPCAAGVLPPRVCLDVRPQRVLPTPGLVDRVDLTAVGAGSGPPLSVFVGDRSTLDLEDEDPCVRDEDDEVELMVLALVGEADVGQDRPLRRGGGHHLLPDLTFGRRLELRVVGEDPWAGAAHLSLLREEAAQAIFRTSLPVLRPSNRPRRVRPKSSTPPSTTVSRATSRPERISPAMSVRAASSLSG